MKRVKIINKTTGEIIDAKSYGNGWICCRGNFYHRAHWRVHLTITE
jgi:hypothetical protein